MSQPIYIEEEQQFREANIQRELKTLAATRKLLEELSSTINLDQILHKTIEAIRSCFPSQAITYFYNDTKEGNISHCYIYSMTSIAEEFFPRLESEMHKFVDSLEEEMPGKQAIKTILTEKKYLFEIVEGNLDEQGSTPVQYHFTPFLSEGELKGFFSVGFPNDMPLSETIKKRIDDVIECAALNFSRLHNLIAIENEQSIQMAKLESEFISIASHQLRTPLTTIIWHLEMLLAGDLGELPQEQKEIVEIVFKNSKKLVDLVKVLLNTSRLDAGRVKVDPKPLNLKSILEDNVQQVKEHAEKKGCVIEMHLEEEAIPEISLDKMLIDQAIHNLLTNAIRYSQKDGGKITVTLQKEENLCHITVSDNGIGIPIEAQEKLFTKFFRADNARSVETEGTGLGLYLVKMVADLCDGSVKAESPKSDGKGTVFHLEIPFSGMKKKEGDVGLAE